MLSVNPQQTVCVDAFASVQVCSSIPDRHGALNRVTFQGQLGGVDHDLVRNATPYAVMQSRIFGFSQGAETETPEQSVHMQFR